MFDQRRSVYDGVEPDVAGLGRKDCSACDGETTDRRKWRREHPFLERPGRLSSGSLSGEVLVGWSEPQNNNSTALRTLHDGRREWMRRMASSGKPRRIGNRASLNSSREGYSAVRLLGKVCSFPAPL